MSHGLPGQPPANLFGFGAVGPGDMNAMAATDGQDSAMMGMLDSSMFGFDTMPMSLDGADGAGMPQTFAPVGTAPSGAETAMAQALGRGAFPRGAVEDNNVPGAGPLPATTIGAALSLPGGSTLTEFTKRRNWPAKVVEELQDVLQILDAHGRVKHISPSITHLTGWSPEEIVDRPLKDLIHPDDVGLFVAELDESIATGNPTRLFYRLRRRDGSYAIFESVGHAHMAAARFALDPNNQSPFCQAVLVMSRPYPTKNASLLDSFLEHKIENERLKRRIAELRREEADEAEDARHYRRQSQAGRPDVAPSEDTTTVGTTPVGISSFMHSRGGDPSMPPPERPASSLNLALTRENLEGAIAGSRPDSVRDKMALYEGATHADTIEMLTGLRYQEGERSHGITTGNASPTLIKGDAGIAIPIDRDPRTGEKKKKLKVAEEYVCTDCGTLDSPEWRKGPSGPKTLCNACGLRWAKKEKKKNANSGAGGNGPPAIPLVDHTTSG